MEGTSSLEPLEQSVLNTLSATRPEEGITEELSNREQVALLLPDITLDGRPMEGTTNMEHSALAVSLDSGLWRRKWITDIRNWNCRRSRY